MLRIDKDSNFTHKGGGTPDSAEQAAEEICRYLQEYFPEIKIGSHAWIVSIIRSFESQRVAALEKDKERLDEALRKISNAGLLFPHQLRAIADNALAALAPTKTEAP